MLQRLALTVAVVLGSVGVAFVLGVVFSERARIRRERCAPRARGHTSPSGGRPEGVGRVGRLTARRRA